MIRVGVSKHKGFAPVSWLIMLCEKTDFSHAFVEFYSKSLDRHLIYHATGSGVHFIGKKAFEDQNVIVKEWQIQTSDSQQKKTLQWCVDEAGKPYSQLQILCIGIKRFFRLFGIKINFLLRNKNKAYICSELVGAILSELGHEISKEELDMMGLQELMALLDKLLCGNDLSMSTIE